MAKQLNSKNEGDIAPKTASTAFKVGDCLSFASGYLVPGGSGKIKGISNESVASTDSDYASTRDLNFTGFNHDDLFIFPVITGTATQAIVGTVVDIAASDASGVDVTASTNKQVEITRFINATTVIGRFVPQTA